MAAAQERDRRAEKPLRFFLMTEGEPRKPFAETDSQLPDNMQDALDENGEVICIPFRFHNMLGTFSLYPESGQYEERFIKGADFPLGNVHTQKSFDSDGNPYISQAPLVFAINFDYSEDVEQEFELVQQFGAKVMLGETKYKVLFNYNSLGDSAKDLLKRDERTTSHTGLEREDGTIPDVYIPYNNTAIRNVEVEFFRQEPNTGDTGTEIFTTQK